MADSTVNDISKMKVVELRKELKARGLSHTGDKADLVARLQASLSQDDHGDLTLDSDEIDSDGVLEDEDDKNQVGILDDTPIDTLNEELALAAPASTEPAKEVKPQRILKRKITSETAKEKAMDTISEECGSKKIVLNRSIPNTLNVKPELEIDDDKTSEDSSKLNSKKIKISAEVDPKLRLEMRAKRFGLPIKVSEIDKKEARKERFNQNSTNMNSGTKVNISGSLSENLDKLKKRAERFGQSVSKIMTDIENKERLEKRKAKFGK